jgi:serine/threonine-protein kinase
MAPEVVRGEPAQPTSDIYSLGVILYEMLTGALPFDGPTSAAIAARQLQDPVPSPQSLNSGVPTSLNDVVMRAMQKEPERRFSSAAEMLGALTRVRDWLRTGQAPAWPPQQEETPVAKPPAYEPEERSEGFLKSFVVTLLGVLAVAVLTATLILYFTGRQQGIEVPDLIGKTLEQARTEAERRGIQLEEYRREYNSQYAPGQIYMTNPPPGSTVPKDNPKVQVWISKGPEMKTVPGVVGLTLAEARRRINDAGLVMGNVTSEPSETVEAGHIVRQSPVAGQTVEPLKQVDVVLSTGSAHAPTTAIEGGTDEGSDTAGPPSGQPRERSFSVEVNVPDDARGPQDVRIEVADAYGNTVAYEETRSPGDHIRQTVKGYGDDIEIKIYIADRLVRDVIYSGDAKVKDRTYTFR